ncbi:MAG: hypothetical protein KC620_17900, partial [Myxococcales bacterium]|nr:hypothetical protein [Myxococcales bacterium]
PTDAAPPDARPHDAAPADAAPADAGPNCPPPPDRQTHFVQAGHCFEHTPPCCVDADCPADMFGCIAESGHCRAWEICNCAADADCPDGFVCLSNERICGGCFPQRPACVGDGQCPAGEHCIGGRCADCPDGDPMARCAGPPDPGPCDAIGTGWAYAPDLQGCVPFQNGGCEGAGNGFEDPNDCLDTCRPGDRCTVRVEALVNGRPVRSRECPVPATGATCAVVGFCVCDVLLNDGDEPPTLEDLRRCTYSMVQPRAQINLSDTCNGGVDLFTALTRAQLPDGRDQEVAITPDPACRALQARISDEVAICEDARQNGWEAGIDCGSPGCAVCR